MSINIVFARQYLHYEIDLRWVWKEWEKRISKDLF
jgi:hypothetical protein